MKAALLELQQQPGWALLVESLRGAKKRYQADALVPCSSIDELVKKNVLVARVEQLDFCIKLPNTLAMTCDEDLQSLREQLEREQEDAQTND